MKKVKQILLISVLSISILSLSSGKAQALLVDPFGNLVEFAQIMTDAILRLSDDIGVMADRIVATETLMADTLVQMQAISASASTTDILLLQPSTGATVSRSIAPTFTTSDNATHFVIYASSTPSFNSEATVPVLVDTATLETGWALAVQSSVNDTLFLAVKSVDESNRLSNISNVVKVALN